jgi:hypothetical protein
MLVRLPGPIRSLRGHEDLLSEQRTINAPREIIRLVNWLMTSELDLVRHFSYAVDLLAHRSSG